MNRVSLSQLLRTVSLRPVQRRSRRLRSVEQLETRTLLATITWNNASGGSWHTAANWDLGRVPATGDDVVIPDLAGSQDVSISTGQVTISSLTITEKVSVSSGTLQVVNSVSGSGELRLNGGSLRDTSIPSSISLKTQNGTLDGVTVNGDFRISGHNGVSVKNGLTLNGTATLGDPTDNSSGHLLFIGPQSLNGTGQIVFGTESTLNSLLMATADSTLTVGHAITITGKGGYLGYNPNLSQPHAGLGHPAALMILQGVLRWDAGTDIRFVSSIVNQGTIFVSSTGMMKFDGHIIGGTVNSEPGAQFAGVTLDGVTVNGDFRISGHNGVSVKNGLTLNGTATLGDPTDNSSGHLLFIGPQFLNGTGQIVFGTESTLNSLLMATADSTLTVGHAITITGKGGYLGYNPNLSQPHAGLGHPAALMILEGTLRWTGGSSFVAPTNLLNHGVVANARPASVRILGNHTNDKGFLQTSVGSSIIIDGHLTGSTTATSEFVNSGEIEFAGGTLASPRLLEVMSLDRGLNGASTNSNFYYNVLRLGTSTNVLLIDDHQNSAGTAPEVLYVGTLVVPAGSTLDLNGKKLYTRLARIDGTVTGGSISQIPDSGPLSEGAPTPGAIGAVGELDEWTFYARAGRSVTILLNPATSGKHAPISPVLDRAQFTLIGPTGNVVAAANNAVSGGAFTLPDILLNAEGTYKLQVRPAAGFSNNTGNYTVAWYDVTADVSSTTIGETAVGAIESEFGIDRWNFAATQGQQIRFDLRGATNADLAFTLTGPNGFTAFTDITADSDLVTLPSTGSYQVSVHGRNGATGDYSFQLVETTITELPLSQILTRTNGGTSAAQLFRIHVTTASPLIVRLDDSTNSNRNELYVRHSLPPTRGEFDHRSMVAAGADHAILVPNATPGDWYVLVYGAHVPAPSSFTVQAVASGVVLSDSTPDSFGTNSTVQLTLTGAGFRAGTTVQLLGAGNSVIATASDVQIDSFTQVTATMSLAGVAQGNYSIRVSLPGGVTDTLPNALTVLPAGAPKLETRLIMPRAFGRHATATIFVEYANTGTVAMPAPLLRLQSADPDDSDKPLLTLDQSRVIEGFWGSGIPDGFASSVQILASGASPGLLNPGEKITVPVYYIGLQQPWNFSDNSVEMEIRIFDSGNTDAVPWPTLKEELRPQTIVPEAWDAIFSNLTTSVGSNWGNFVEMLSDNAKYLNRLGRRVVDVSELWSFELQQAIGFSPVRTLASSVDASITTPGSDLSFGRFWSLSLGQRFSTSLFGRGWSTPWQTRLTVDTDGTVNIHGAGGSRRQFAPDTRSASKFFALPGDAGTLVRVATGIYEVREQNGSVTRFKANGQLDYSQDVNGNRVTSGYDASSRLATLTSSSGASITIAYNAAGLIQSLTDSTGRVSSFTYDPTNQYLLTATGPDNVVTAYTYDTTPNSPRRHSLTSVTSGGVTQAFGFDTRGRLSSAATKLSPTTETARINFSYDTAGRVSVSDAGGGTTSLFYDERGLLTKVTDPFGNVTTTEYGDDLRISRIVDPLGQSQAFTWCGCGSLTSSTDQLGHKTTFTNEYVGPNNTIRRMTSFTDANGNTTRYTYDSKGNLTSTIYPNGSVERTTAYDPMGDPLTFINRRGQVMNYTYNAAGQVTRQTFNDNSFIDLAYDARGNLFTVTEPGNKVTTYTYDSGDRLTKVLYPQGRFLEFGYDAAGRRATMTDQLGYVVRYSYDAAGRLFQLRDTDNTLIVEYLYDAAGRLSRTNKGNGTYTIHTYDAAGQILSIFNRAPNGSVNSSFVYTYDVLGRRDSMTTIDGKWIYGYDPTEQLTSAIFTPVAGSPIPAQNLQYVYDPLGNRIRTIENGVTTEYTTNNLNQYTHVGSDTLVYDADGNLISRSGPSGNASYSYDQQSRLVRAATTDGTWQYKYDSAGNLESTSLNGVATEYLLDPTGIGYIVSNNVPLGDIVTRYVYGFGLVATRDSGSAGYEFFDYDAMGNTASTTQWNGDLQHQFAFAPFGTNLSGGRTQSTMYRFGGQFGVMQNASNFYFMRDRFYLTDVGVFTSQDPSGVAGGGVDLDNYAFNNPISFADPDGNSPIPGIIVALLVSYSSIAPPSLPPNPGNGVQYVQPVKPSAGWDVKGLVRRVGDAAGDVYEEVQDPEVRRRLAKGAKAIGRGIANAVARGATTAYGAATRLGPLAPGSLILAGDAWLYKHPKELRAFSDAVLDLFYGELGHRANSIAAQASDPNDLLGPSGYGSSNFVRSNAALPYRINFENYGPGSVEHDGTPAPASRWATAPAQQVEITNVLPSQIDLDAFTLTGFGFGDFNIAVPNSAQHHEQVLSMTFGGKTFDVWCSATLDRVTRTLRILFQSIDPNTELPPDVLTGFLPPEDGTGRGKGFITYTARPIAGLTTGTEIRNIALISFDRQTEIATDQVDPLDPSQGIDPTRQALVTIDAGTPTSQINALPTTSATTIPLSWTGSDDSGGSGVGVYNVFVSDNGGPYTSFLQSTTLTSTTFTGQPGHSYRFYSVAVDNVGQFESVPATPDAVTSVPLAITAPAKTTAVQRPVAQWSPVFGAVSYDVWLNNMTNGTTILVQTNVTTRSYTPTVDLGIGTFALWVRSVDASGNKSAWSPRYDFRINTPVVLQSMVRNQETHRPTVSWTAIPGATKYDFWLDNRTTGQSQFVRNQNITGTSWTPTIDLPLGVYRGWVRAIDAGGTAATWSIGVEFRVTPKVTVQSLAAQQATSRPTISWASMPGASKYDIWIENRTAGQSQYIRNQNVTTTSFTPSTDMPIGVYRVWVRAFDSTGYPTNWSTVKEFTVATPPVITSPLNSTFNRRPSFNWNAVAGATSYEVQIRNLGTGATVYNPKNITALTWTPPADLPVGSYRWWVVAKGANNVQGLWTAPVDINIGGQTQLLTPTGATTNTKPLFSWKQVDGAVRYELWVTNTTLNTTPINLTNLTTLNHTPATALPKGNYRAWVRAVSSTGEIAAWSATAQFTIASLEPDSASEGDGTPFDMTLALLQVTELRNGGWPVMPNNDGLRTAAVPESSDGPVELDEVRSGSEDPSFQATPLVSDHDAATEFSAGDISEESLDLLMAQLQFQSLD